MSMFEWTKDLSVGIEVFDKQHQKLVKIINNLHNGMKKGKGKELLTEIFEELLDYTVYHFQAEESLFEKHHYPETENHKQLHQSLIEKVKSLKKDHTEGQILVSVNTLKVLNNWVIKHIQVEDKKYSSFFEKKLV